MSDIKTLLDDSRSTILAQNFDEHGTAETLSIGFHSIEAIVVERGHQLKDTDVTVRGISLIQKIRINGKPAIRRIDISLFSDDADKLKCKQGDISKAISHQVDIRTKLAIEDEQD